MAISVIPLKCPACAGVLTGFETDQIFFCPACPAGWDFSGAAPSPIKLSYAQADLIPRQYRQIFYLPFYYYRISSFALNGGDRIQERVIGALKELKGLYVPGYQLLRESYFGDLGLIYTERKIEMEEDTNRGNPAWRRLGSATRSPKEAEAYLKHYPLLIIDKRQDITGMELRIESNLDRVWAVPFFDMGKQIQDGIIGKGFSAFALDTMAEFRKTSY